MNLIRKRILIVVAHPDDESFLFGEHILCNKRNIYHVLIRLMCNDIVEIYLGLKSFRFILGDFSLLIFWVVLTEILITVFYNLGRNVYKGNN